MRLIYPNSIFPPNFCPQTGRAVSMQMRLVRNHIRYMYEGHWRSSGNSVLFWKQDKKLIESIYNYSDSSIFPPQNKTEAIWIHPMLHVQDLELSYDSARKS